MQRLFTRAQPGGHQAWQDAMTGDMAAAHA
jgi:hypothetical protein